GRCAGLAEARPLALLELGEGGRELGEPVPGDQLLVAAELDREAEELRGVGVLAGGRRVRGWREVGLVAFGEPDDALGPVACGHDFTTRGPCACGPTPALGVAPD